ncbi:hypothetical protein [Actinospica robiniae]|nr:hypothetical protein [Actinospica robiniae]
MPLRRPSRQLLRPDVWSRLLLGSRPSPRVLAAAADRSFAR